MLRIIICGYNPGNKLQMCLASVEMQTMRDFKISLSIDQEPRKYLLKNTIDTARECRADSDDVFVFLDADDWLADENAFEIIQNAYEDSSRLLLTYGSYCNLSDNKKGKFCGPYLPGEDFAASQWRGSHLKTMKKKLFDAIPEDRFKDEDEKYFKCCADRALMIPAMELAGYERIKWVETILYCYNDLNPASCWKTNRELSIKTRQYISSRRPLGRLP